ncbi:MAG TPA: hypothetical protein VFY18_13735 [Candidatus Limnocylindrales bacterium]|nr:hypothetical protein [Candidatus Limnocylindrales bacterium]
MLLSRATAVAAIVSATIAAGCGGPAPPASDGLLVATGGPLQVTDGSGDLAAFDGPEDPVVAVTASGGHVVAATAAGPLVTSSGAGGKRTWLVLDIPGAPGPDFSLMAISPIGKRLALVVGEPQGASFDLVIADIGVGTSRSFAIERGLNGAPTWIGPGTIAIDVIKPAGASAIAAIDAGSGVVTDDALPGRVVSATLDGTLLALDDPETGEVLVGEAGVGGLDQAARIAHLAGPPGSAVDGLALSPDGGRLAVVRRTDAGLASIETYRRLEQGWTGVRTLNVAGDGPVSLAWLQ